MPKKQTGNKEQKIPIGDTEDCYLLVNFDWEVIKHHKRIEDFYGSHEFNEDEVNYTINFASVWLGNAIVKTWGKDELTPLQLLAIENLLTIED